MANKLTQPIKTNRIEALNNIGKLLFTPHRSIADVGERRQARLFSILLLTLTALIGVRIIIGFISGTAFTDPSFPLYGVIVGFVLL